jgi:hypothetical protein
VLVRESQRRFHRPIALGGGFTSLRISRALASSLRRFSVVV